ncbi:hypothetical protein [Sphingomonas endolithica]|uniref:hypothetical protein n=1 Tax=Sphingomonas endolithica TaxID=2972485 RepID=UPI0021AEC76C|nr:hypothetical protein [Sphingomonas sp. ZFBP2030]
MAAMLALTASPAIAAAPRMTVQTFLTKVAALKQKGMMALFSPDVSLIKAEAKTATVELKAEAKAREAAGKPPIACPPKGGQNKMSSTEFVKAMETIPVAERGMSFKDGLSRVIVAKYPCRR